MGKLVIDSTRGDQDEGMENTLGSSHTGNQTHTTSILMAVGVPLPFVKPQSHKCEALGVHCIQNSSMLEHAERGQPDKTTSF